MNSSFQQNQTSNLHGKVTDANNHPIAQATLLFTAPSPTHNDIAALTNASGEYRFTNLIPGLYTVMVNAEGFSQQTQQIQLNAGETAQLNFQLGTAS